MKSIGKQEPAMDNFPMGDIDWVEISTFIVDMLEPDIHCRKGWKIIKNSTMTAELKKNSLTVLHTLHADLYEYFYNQHDDRFKVWKRMEAFVRTKYAGLSDKALSRVIGRYRIDDR